MLDQNILICKLSHYGVCCPFLQRIKSYLIKWSQRTRIGQCMSEPLRIKCGVPQGSILGPRLFIVYMSDITTVTPPKTLLLYADDCMFLVTDKSLQDVKRKVVFILESLTNWFKNSKQSLNISKTKGIIFSRSTKILSQVEGSLLCLSTQLNLLHGLDSLG